MKVVLYSKHWNPFWCLPPDCVNQLRSEFPDVDFVHARTEEQFLQSIQDAEVYFGYNLRKSHVDAARRLQWIHVPAASIYPLMQLGLKEKGTLVTNSRGLHAVPVSEHVLGCMLVFSRKFIESWKLQQARQYGAREILLEPPPPGELRGKTVLIFGLGGIGMEVARLSNAFGMRVLAIKKDTAGKYDFVERVFGPDNFRQALPEADYIVISLPRTQETEGMIGRNEMELLKKSCVLINVARASVVDQSAMIQALKENRIRGVALDVFEQEPLPSDSELFSLPNVFLTPHTSGVSALEHWPRMIQLFSINLNRYIKRQPLLNVVNLQEGY